MTFGGVKQIAENRPQFGLIRRFPGSVPLPEKTDDSGHRRSRTRRLVLTHKRLAPALRLALRDPKPDCHLQQKASPLLRGRTGAARLYGSRGQKTKGLLNELKANSDNGPEPDIITKSTRPEAERDLLSQDGIRPMGAMSLCAKDLQR